MHERARERRHPPTRKSTNSTFKTKNYIARTWPQNVAHCMLHNKPFNMVKKGYHPYTPGVFEMVKGRHTYER